MNRRPATISLLLSALAIASCGSTAPASSEPDISTWTDVTRDVYSVAALKLEGNLQAAKMTTEHFKVNPAMPHILYCDLQTYFRCLLPSFPKKTTAEVTKDHVIVRVNGQNAFIGGIDTENDRFYFVGSVGSGYAAPTDYSKTSLTLGSHINGTSSGVKNEYTSYADYQNEIPVIEKSDAFYAPISLFDLAFKNAFGVYHFDNLESLYQISSTDDLKTPLDDSKTLITDNVSRFYEANNSKVPDDLLALERAAFYCAFDAQYGLAHSRNINKMSDYFKDFGYDQDMLDSNKDLQAYGSLIADLSDGHTGFSGIAPYWGDTAEEVPSSRFRYNMTAMKASLSSARAAAYKEHGGDPADSILYSDSGETAFISFDSFSIAYDAFEEDGKTPVADLWKKDSFFYLAHQLAEIKNKGGVKRVIIDDSCNGGGIVAVAMKILALISRENKSRFYMYDWRKELLETYVTDVDSNLDGEFNLDDVYGDDFEIAILTSSYSFSCGNALPYLAKRHGHAKIIGLTSGGGECVVGQTMLPSGRQFRHSSNRLIADYDASTHQVVTNAEDGASPDITITFDHFYDINALESYLKA